jgi:hypothetical protein
LLKKDVARAWSEKAKETFNTFKEKLLEFPILRILDFSKVFILHTNWSARGIGAISNQLDKEGKKYVIPYAFRSNKVKSNYSSYEGECLIVVWAIIHFMPYLYGTKFILCTDHQPIKWLMTNDTLTGKLACWALYLKSMSSRLFIDLVLQIRMRIPCHEDPLIPLEISQKPNKILTTFQ